MRRLVPPCPTCRLCLACLVHGAVGHGWPPVCGHGCQASQREAAGLYVRARGWQALGCGACRHGLESRVASSALRALGWRALWTRTLGLRHRYAAETGPLALP
jgi:hypothetical protein